jgi:hypothetical protein
MRKRRSKQGWRNSLKIRLPRFLPSSESHARSSNPPRQFRYHEGVGFIDYWLRVFLFRQLASVGRETKL